MHVKLYLIITAELTSLGGDQTVLGLLEEQIDSVY